MPCRTFPSALVEAMKTDSPPPSPVPGTTVTVPRIAEDTAAAAATIEVAPVPESRLCGRAPERATSGAAGGFFRPREFFGALCRPITRSIGASAATLDPCRAIHSGPAPTTGGDTPFGAGKGDTPTALEMSSPLQ
ncbi:hypothetical protein GCM10009547_20560 [Sporichthya brevicatena]|uniref:Uncharacterized protein n=1 Tax=Sporichthya brevicatena TaxID=171442 RepID=A0ABN1GSG7_9ACTN